MHTLCIIGTTLLIVIVIMIMSKRTPKTSEKYLLPTPNTSAGFAAMFQETPLPSSDTLAEEGGGYAITQGIESPQLTKEQDPWL